MGKSLTTEQFIEKAICKHSWSYNYAKVDYVTTHVPIVILCLKCGNCFKQTPNAHLSGCGCPKCGILSSGNSKKKSTNKFIEDSICVHGWKYNYKAVHYVNAHTKVKIWCHACKKYFWQTPNNHCIHHHGCLTCSGQSTKRVLFSGGFKKLNLPSYDTYFRQIEKYNDAYKIIRNIDGKNIRLLGVACAYCAKVFVPNLRSVHSRLSVIKGKHGGDSNFYCSDSCKESCPTFNKIKYPKGFKKSTSREVSAYLRKLCFKRDDWECQKCEATTNLHCHHIKGYTQTKMLANDIDNVITLCKKCHKDVHKQQGCSYFDLSCKQNKRKE